MRAATQMSPLLCAKARQIVFHGEHVEQSLHHPPGSWWQRVRNARKLLALCSARSGDRNLSPFISMLHQRLGEFDSSGELSFRIPPCFHETKAVCDFIVV